MTATIDTETRRVRAQAQAERRVESCERPAAKYASLDVEDEEGYTIIKAKRPVAQIKDEPDEEV